MLYSARHKHDTVWNVHQYNKMTIHANSTRWQQTAWCPAHRMLACKSITDHSYTFY